MSAEARARYEEGLARYQDKDYAGAIRAFDAGYALEPRREFLFANAQAKRLAGDCRGAVPLYQQFLASDPPALQVNAAHIGLGRCAQQLAERPERPPVVIAPPPPLPPPPPRPRPWYRDPWGAALVGTGAVALGVGAGFMAASFSARADAHATGNQADYDRHWADASARWDVAVAGLVTGGVLVAAGAGRYAWVRRRSHERGEVTLTVAPGLLALRGSF
jgi:hypothetical protein